MSISSIASNAPPVAPTKPSSAESSAASSAVKEAEHDGDSDDGPVAAAPPTQSVTNSLGQEIGKNLNVSA